MSLISTAILARNLNYWAIMGAGYDALRPDAQRTLFSKTWELQDGYGVPGLAIPQGWDWSGIRDSTDAAAEKIAQYIQALFAREGVAIDDAAVNA